MENNNWMNGNYPNPNEYNSNATLGPNDFRNTPQSPGEMQYGAQPMNPQFVPPETACVGEQTVSMGAYRRDESVPVPPVQPPWQNAAQGYNPYAAPAPMAPDYGAFGNPPPQGYPGEYAPNNAYYAPPVNVAPAPMAPDYGAFANPPQNYPTEPVPNNGYYAPPAPNYEAYPYPPQQKKKSGSPMMYVLIIIMSLCFIAVAALCIYFITDSKGEKDSKTKEPSITSPTAPTGETSDPMQTLPIPNETEANATETLPTEAPTTEAPTTEPPTTEPPTTEASHQFLDELNRKYGNYFDFQPDENGYVIADSSSRLISKQELYGMTEHEVCIARNELYARHGYIFQTEQYNEYFKNFSWYHPTTTTLPTLSEIESENAKIIAAYESEKGW